MTLTPEQKAAGWIEWNGGECPIKDARTTLEVEWSNVKSEVSSEWDCAHLWTMGGPFHITAYRIIEAHGADAEPARPTPFPADYSDLVFDDAGWSQTIIVDGKRPEWLRDDDEYTVGISGMVYKWTRYGGSAFAIRVRRREPKRETRRLAIQIGVGFLDIGTIDLINGKPDLSTLKIAEGAL